MRDLPRLFPANSSTRGGFNLAELIGDLQDHSQYVLTNMASLVEANKQSPGITDWARQIRSAMAVKRSLPAWLIQKANAEAVVLIAQKKVQGAAFLGGG